MKNICILGVGGAGANILGKIGKDIRWTSCGDELKMSYNIKYGYISTSLEEILAIQEIRNRYK